MIYRINSDFDNLSLEKLTKAIDGVGELLIYKDVIYLKSFNEKCDKSFIKRTIRKAGSSECFIVELTKETCDNEPEYIRAWFADYFTALAEKEVEEAKQAELKLKRDQLELLRKIITGEVKVRYKETGGTSNGGRS